MNRQEALAITASRYQGKPCKYGHEGERYTKTKACVECVAGYDRSKYPNKWWITNPEASRKYQRDYTKLNPEIIKPAKQKYRKNNRGQCNAHNAKYRACKLQATPVWADLDAIRFIYENCPAGFHVDHVMPLQGENVCGLHVHINLQYLEGAENMSKGNRLVAPDGFEPSSLPEREAS